MEKDAVAFRIVDGRHNAVWRFRSNAMGMPRSFSEATAARSVIAAYLGAWCLALQCQIEAIEVHHFFPRGDEIANEVIVFYCIDLGDRPKLRV